eukprot:CAMPEP_0172865722 /NCGR_PEP_ID=MMETSP1075-20121228/81573_1 /TAXON_ID=2916 /ORGANISM="Ceratium fusus, Strain PA161109" /LENGTH=296 /DNA_ID=CAMNT_0013714801 /DNA_START=50 /DNA_END=940 /DNA_ORIENTATION=-
MSDRRHKVVLFVAAPALLVSAWFINRHKPLPRVRKQQLQQQQRQQQTQHDEDQRQSAVEVTVATLAPRQETVAVFTIQSVLHHVLAQLTPRDAVKALSAVSATLAAACLRTNIQSLVEGFGLWSTLSPVREDSTSSSCLEHFFLKSNLTGGPLLWLVQRRRRQVTLAREVDWLLRWRADVNERDNNGWTPLLWVANQGSAQLCRLLLERRANPDQIGSDGSSALGQACRSAHLTVVKELLAVRASPDLVAIGNGNLDNHAGEEIMELVRKARLAERVRKRVQVYRLVHNFPVSTTH